MVGGGGGGGAGGGPLNIGFNEVNKAKLFTLVRVLSST